MTEPALGIAGVVLLAAAIVALFLRPRRSKGRMVDAGLAAGAGLLGLAIGLVVADRVHRPEAVLAAPTEPAAPSTGRSRSVPACASAGRLWRKGASGPGR